jgi:hypothetical protein
VRFDLSSRRHGEEIELSDYLTVILEKGEPLLTGATAPHHAMQISSHGAFRDGKAKLDVLQKGCVANSCFRNYKT